MLTLAIGTEMDVDKIYQKIVTELNSLVVDGVKSDIQIKRKGNLKFLSCTMVVDWERATLPIDELGSLFKHYVANGVAEYILEKYENDLINKIIKNNFDYFSKEEQEQVVQYACKILKESEDKYKKNYLSRINRKNKIIYRMLEYLEENNELVISGFINFRLKDYFADLEDAVNKAIDEYLMEKEYQEFIKLLRYFVDVQEPRISQVHVVIEGAGLFKLLDHQKQVISNDYLEDFILDITDSEINYDDLLVSALITIAPEKIILHCSPAHRTKEVVETILNVFTGRVTTCTGCELCELKPAEQLNFTPFNPSR
jgi:putative sporulation protein YtxC